MSITSTHINRRELVALGAAATAAVVLPASAIGIDAPYRVLYDRESEAGRAFGRMAARRGSAVVGVGMDPGSVWMDVIEPRLRAAPVTIAGLTTGATLFCLEYLGRSYGLCTAYRKEIDAPTKNIRSRDLSLVDLSGGKGQRLYNWMLIPR